MPDSWIFQISTATWMLQNATPSLRKTEKEREEMSTEVKKIKSGILVSIKTRQTGGRSYKKREIEQPHLTEGGVEVSEWTTRKVVFDPAEAKEAGQVANKARYLVTRLCAETDHGPLCPVERRGELDAAIVEARELVDAFNAKAVFTRVEVNVIRGEIVADDLETVRALFSETEQLMTKMQEALEKLDVKRIQQLCTKALSVGQMLSPEANASVVAAVRTAREARKKIVAAGEQAAIAIDQHAIDAIGLARNSFLDFDTSADESPQLEWFNAPRALDFEVEEEAV